MPIKEVTDPGKWRLRWGILIPSCLLPTYLELSLLMAWTGICLPRGLPYLRERSIDRCPRGRWLPGTEPGSCWEWQSPCWPEPAPRPGRGETELSRGGLHWAPSPGVGRLGREDTAKMSASELGSSSYVPGLLTMKALAEGSEGKAASAGFSKSRRLPETNSWPPDLPLISWPTIFASLGGCKIRMCPSRAFKLHRPRSSGIWCELIRTSSRWCCFSKGGWQESQSKRLIDHKAFIWVRE